MVDMEQHGTRSSIGTAKPDDLEEQGFLGRMDAAEFVSNDDPGQAFRTCTDVQLHNSAEQQAFNTSTEVAESVIHDDTDQHIFQNDIEFTADLYKPTFCGENIVSAHSVPMCSDVACEVTALPLIRGTQVGASVAVLQRNASLVTKESILTVK